MLLDLRQKYKRTEGREALLLLVFLCLYVTDRRTGETGDFFVFMSFLSKSQQPGYCF